MTTPQQLPGEQSAHATELEVIASLCNKKGMDGKRLADKMLEHRQAMDVRAWHYRLISLAAGLGVFGFLSWFAVRLADQGNTFEAVGVVGFGGLPMVALFVTGEVVSRRMLK